MTPEIATCLIILAVAVVLFAWDRIPADVVALGVLLSLVFTGLLPTDKAFAGFGSDTVIMILGLLIMTGGLVRTGVVEKVGRLVFDFAGRSAWIFLPVIMGSVALASTFMSNTAATAFFVPLVLGYAAKTRTSPSDYLLPLAFASILSSSITLVGTSTNIVVSDLLTQYQQPPIGMFEMSPVGIPIALAGLLYVWTLGVKLIPKRHNQKVAEEIGERQYQAEIVVAEESPLVGKTLDEADLDKEAGFSVREVVRNGKHISSPQELARITIEAEDELVIEGLRRDLLKVKDIKGLDFKADLHEAERSGDGADKEQKGREKERGKDKEKEEEKEEVTVVEAVLLPNSRLIGENLQRLNFKDRYGLDVLALHRAGRVPPSRLPPRLRMGDVLLLQGTPENVKALERGNLFNIFGGVDTTRLNLSRAPLAVIIFFMAMTAATLKLVPIAVAVLSGAFLMLATRCISPEDAYRHVEWKVLILIGSLLSLGAAMESSGAGKYLANQLIEVVGTQQIHVLLSCFFFLTVALTQPMSNQAAAVVVLPIAVQVGLQLGINPRPFAMMVAIAASCSYLTPLEPACLMVYGPGKYQFLDFVKVGAPLTVLIYLIAVILVPIVWGL